MQVSPFSYHELNTDNTKIISNQKLFKNQNFNSNKLCIHTIILYKWKCFLRSQTPTYIPTKRKLIKKLPKIYSPQLITRKHNHTVPHAIPQLIIRKHNHMVPHAIPQLITRKHNHTVPHAIPQLIIRKHNHMVPHAIPQLITRKHNHMVPYAISQLIIGKHNHMVHMTFT
jgi:hypothetical protein